MHLVINGGAYQGRIELGGLSLLSLEVNDGASDVKLEFSEPNGVVMDTLKYSTGASNVELSGLANANFKSMVFRAPEPGITRWIFLASCSKTPR
jgi:hypothetical protein